MVETGGFLRSRIDIAVTSEEFRWLSYRAAEVQVERKQTLPLNGRSSPRSGFRRKLGVPVFAEYLPQESGQSLDSIESKQLNYTEVLIEYELSGHHFSTIRMHAPCRRVLCLVHCFISAGQQYLALLEAQWVSVLWGMVTEDWFGASPMAKLQRVWKQSGCESVSQELGEMKAFNSLFCSMNWGHQRQMRGEGRGIPWGRGSQYHLQAMPVLEPAEGGVSGVMVEASAWVLG